MSPDAGTAFGRSRAVEPRPAAGRRTRGKPSRVASGRSILAVPAAVLFLLAATAGGGPAPLGAKKKGATPAAPEAEARRASVRSIRARLSLDPKGAVEFDRLERALRDGAPSVRGEAVLALGKTGSRGLPRVIGALRDRDPDVRRKAIRVLRWAGPGGHGVIAAVAEAVADGAPPVRRDALQALLDFGDAAAPATASLRNALGDPDEISRGLAVEVLRRIGAGAVPVLREALSAGDRGVRGRCARILGELGDRSEAVVPELEALAADRREDPWVRHEANRAVEAIRLRSSGRRPSAEDVPHFLESLKIPALTEEEKAAVLGVFRSLGKPMASDEQRNALRAMPDEVLLARYEAGMRKDRREKVATAIARAGPGAEARLFAVLASGEAEARACALVALSKLGSTGPDMLAALDRALGDPEPAVRSAGAKALGDMGEKAADRVPALAAMLDDPDPGIRREAISALGRVDPAGMGSIPAVVRALGDRDDEVRSEAFARLTGMTWRSDGATPRILAALPRDETGAPDPSTSPALLEKLGPAAVPLLARRFETAPGPSTAAALGLFGPWAGEAVPALEKGLGSDNSDVRRECVVALGRIGPGAKAAVPALAAVLGDRDHSVRHRVPPALARIGLESPDVLRALARAPRESLGREGPLDALAAAGAPAVPHLAALLAEKDPGVRAGAARALGKIGPASGDAVPALLGAVEDDNPDVGIAAAKALDAVGFDPRGVLRRLIDIAKFGKEAYPRAWSVRAIGRIGPEAAAAAPVLLDIVARKSDTPSTDDALYNASLETLARVAPGSARPVIARALKSRHPSWRVHAARILMEQDPAAGDALARPVLLDALAGRDERVRIAAALALLRHDPSTAVAVRALAAEVGSRGDGEAVSAALEKAGSRAVPYLVKIFDDGDPGKRRAAAACLARLGPAAAGAVPALVAALEDDDEATAGAAARTLGAIGPAAKAAVPALADLLRGRGGPLAGYAAEALGDVGTEAASAVPALREALGRSNFITRDKAARALGKIGPAAAEAVPDLVAALENGTAAGGAVDALGRIGRGQPQLVIPLLEKESDPEPGRRVHVAAARLAADPGDEDAVSVLADVMEDGPESERIALSDLDPKALGPGNVGVLSRLLGHGDPAVRIQAAHLFRRLGAEGKDAAALLAAGAGDPDPRVRQSFIEALREIGPGAKDAVPALREALGDWRSSIRWAAFDALSAIDPAAFPPILRP